MIPSVFVSSTIEDLHHLRDAIRDVIVDLGYRPVMSEYGDIPYRHDANAQDSCYRAMSSCHLAVIIIAKRYGDITQNDLSVTHNEYKTAREVKIPVFVVVDHEVVAFKKVYDAQTADRKPSMPGMDDAPKTFAFIEEVSSAPVNNGVLVFKSVSDVRENLKFQMAHLFGDLLKTRIDPLRSGIDDVLSEIKTLRHELGKTVDRESSTAFLRTIRFLLDDENQHYTEVVKMLYDTADAAVPNLVKSNTFAEFVRISGGRIEMVADPQDTPNLRDTMEDGAVRASIFMIGFHGRAQITSFRDKRLSMNQVALDYFEEMHKRLRRMI